MPEPTDPGATRRRIPHESDRPRENRSGCLVWGAVLGVVVGGMFAAYGLKPILRHYYGEQRVAVGQTYEGDAKTIRVAGAGSERPEAFQRPAGERDDGYYVILEVTTNKTWLPAVTDFAVEFSGIDDWVEADAAFPSTNGTIPFPLAEQRTIFLRFKRPATVGAEPEYLHIADPRLRIELPE
ncbi:MAG: hypothetical protein C0506_07840 [Anaerolinea sp.]|nr:hypothetical protein [Anaerolinea sp.]